MPNKLVAFTDAQLTWLRLEAENENRSVSSHIRKIIDTAVAARPLRVFVWKCQFADGANLFAVSPGISGNEVSFRRLSADKREFSFKGIENELIAIQEAHEFAAALAQKYGLHRTDVIAVTEDFRA